MTKKSRTQKPEEDDLEELRRHAKEASIIPPEDPRRAHNRSNQEESRPALKTIPDAGTRKMKLFDPDKDSLKEKLVKAYQEKDEEDLDIVNELDWVGVQIFERLDKEG